MFRREKCVFKPILALAFLCAACSSSEAGQRIVTKEGAVYVVPTGSPVRFAANEEWTSISFTGRFVASGTYEIRYMGEPKPDCEVCTPAWSARFRPARALGARLPHWTRGPVRELEFDNAEAFIDAIAKPDDLARLRSGTLTGISGQATIAVDSFKGQIDCDIATYTVRFVELKGLARTGVAASAAGVPGKC